MKRLLFFALALLVLVPAAVQAANIGVGAFGGLSYPIVQDDAKSGPMFGIRAPVKLIPLVTVEPYFAAASGGDVSNTIAGLSYTLDGLDVKSFGANAMLTMGGPVTFYPFVGLGSSSLKRGSGGSQSFTNYNFGLGLGISPAPKLTIHIRGELEAVVDGKSSRKFGNATVGASYALFDFPVK